MNAAVSSDVAGQPVVPATVTLRADELGKAYGPITVLADVSLEIRAGEVHAIIGENGAGKSTLMKLLSGHVAPTAGHISMEGRPVEFRTAVEAEAAGIVLVHQEILLAGDLTVAENLFLGREIGPGPMVDDRAMNRRTAELLARIGSTARPRDRVSELALAQRQLVQIARALLDDRKVVILDEPTAVLANDEVAALLDKTASYSSTFTSEKVLLISAYTRQAGVARNISGPTSGSRTWFAISTRPASRSSRSATVFKF